MAFTVCPKCGRIESFNPCGCQIAICPECGNVFDATHTRLADSSAPHCTISMALQSIAHWSNGRKLSGLV